MDKAKVTENYEMIKAALKNKIVLDPKKIEELAEYFNNIVVSSIAYKHYKPIIEYDPGDGGDNDDNEDTSLVISVNIPKNDIDTIVGAWTVDETLEDIEELIGEELDHIYAENGIADTEDYGGFSFDVDMEIIDENTIKVEISIEPDWDIYKDEDDDDEEEEELTREDIEAELQIIRKVLPREKADRFDQLTHEILDRME